MSRKSPAKMGDLAGKRPPIFDDPKTNLGDPGETSLNTGVSGQSVKSDEKFVGDPTPPTIAEFVTPAKAAELTGKGVSTIKRYCDAGKFEGAKKALVDGVEVWQIPIASLPPHAQAMMIEEARADSRARCAAIGLPLPAPQDLQFSPAEYSIIWEEYERSGATHKRRAEAAFKALLTFQRVVDEGFSIGEAETEVASRHGVSKPTLWRYRQATKGHPQMHWLPLLSPRYKGGRPPAEFTEAAYEYIRGSFINSSETPLTVVIEAARDLARLNGWVIPGNDAIRSRLAKEPKWVETAGRKGPKALERSYPAIKKDYSSLALHELWESDGRKSDVFCIWPDGTTARPFIIVWREVRSRLVLGVKGYLNPSAAGVLAAFGMALSRAGTAPEFAKIDNGREYAAKSVTGGQANRYRFKVVPGEQPGVMTQVGTQAEWSRPARGQDKPIESFWRFVADRCDKAHEFEGAYCGRNPVVKPESFDRKNAIPIAVYEAKLAQVLEYFNTRHRHSGSGMDGRTPNEVYTELAVHTKRTPVDPAHIRLCKLGVAYIKPDADDASYTLKIPGYGTCRYWSKKIAGLPKEALSRKHSVYYDLENPREPITVYDAGNWLDDAPQFEELPFRNAGEGAANHVKAKNALHKPQIEAVKQFKAAAQGGYPAFPAVTELSKLPPSINEVTIAGTRKPGEKKPANSGFTLTDEDEKELAELERKQQEKRRKANPALYEHIGK